jgi:hypothetical protein
MTQLINIHLSKTGKVSDKWEAYFQVYDRVLTPFRDRVIQLLEIGVQNGGSLETWAEYFSNATKIIGCDVNPSCAALSFSDPRISVVIGNCGTKETENLIHQHCPLFDVVIDDGSHTSTDIIRAFWIYFNRVKPGGLFIVEDTHTLYRESYEGGILKLNSVMNMFKLLSDAVNYEHWRQDLSIQTLFSTFFPASQFPPFLSNGWVEGVEFSNSMIVVRKGTKPGSPLGKRLIAGKDAAVVPAVLDLPANLV